MVQKSKLYKPQKIEGGKKFNGRKDRDQLYDTSWSKYRIRFLSANPLCYCCGKKSTVVDHIVGHRGDIELFVKLDNHLPMCKSDHDFVTASFDKNWTPENFERKLQWIHQMRIKYIVNTAVKVLGRYKT